jgi:hypothetical protein
VPAGGVSPCRTKTGSEGSPVAEIEENHDPGFVQSKSFAFVAVLLAPVFP